MSPSLRPLPPPFLPPSVYVPSALLPPLLPLPLLVPLSGRPTKGIKNCKKPVTVVIPCAPPPCLTSLAASGSGARGGAAEPERPARLPDGCQLAPAADPAELASHIRAFLAAAGGPRAASIEAQLNAAKHLSAIAHDSVADARTIVSVEGLLRRVERNLAEPAGGAGGLMLLPASLFILYYAAGGRDAAISARIAEERDLLPTLVLLAARGPASRGDGSRNAQPIATEARMLAMLALEAIRSSGAAAAGICTLAVDALSDADLQALVEALVGKAGSPTKYSLSFLAACLEHAPLLPRLVGPAGLPLALAKLLADEGPTEDTRMAAGECLKLLIEAAREHGPPLAAWAKPIIKPLRAAFVRNVVGGAAPPESADMFAGHILHTLSADAHLVTAVASGMPDFISCLRGSDFPAVLAAAIIRNLATHPGARAAALREGAVPALVSLASDRKVVDAFNTLGELSSYDDARAAILATDAPLRLRGTV